VSATGRFVIFRLRPPKGSPHHAFWARWDNAVVKGKPGPAVKIELDHPSRRECLAFKRSLNGYAGHWPTHEQDRDRFHIVIVDRGTPVFRGTLSLGLTWAIDFSLVDPDARFQLCTKEGDVIGEIPVAALAEEMIRGARLAKRLMRQGRSRRVAERLALIATAGLGSPSAATIHRPELLPRPRYTRAEKEAMLRRVRRRLRRASLTP
jgi:hypothetical protein